LARGRRSAESDRGMTLAELLAVVAVASIIMGLVITLTTSLAKHDALNLARQSRTDGIRQASIWLGDALAHAASDPFDTSSSVFITATDRQMTFHSALPVEGHTGDDADYVSRVTVLLGETCWDADPDPGVLHRCVQTPLIVNDVASFCTKGGPGCSDALFEDLVVARNVKDAPMFSYALGTDGGWTDPQSEVTGDENLDRIIGVELKVTATGEPGSAYQDLESTVFKRHTIKAWSRQ
jgi:prepilin-type N-terminal cleavage/methylation domain-containing protein